MEHRDRALAKLKLELRKDITLAISVARRCGLTELLFLLYILHFARLTVHLPEKRIDATAAYILAEKSIEESLKYAISLVAKYGRWGKKNEGKLSLNNSLTTDLLKITTHINSKYEFESLIQLFDVEVSGERDKECTIDMSSAIADPTRKKLLEYFFRTEEDNNRRKDRTIGVGDLLTDFKEEYCGAEHLFEYDTGMTLDAFCSQLEKLIQLITERLKAVEHQLAVLPNGNVNIQSEITFFKIARCLIFSKSQLLENLDYAFVEYIEKNCFDEDKMVDKELRYHYVTRRPFLTRGDFIIISPELVLDSLFSNTHYSLIESRNTKANYLAAQSDKFLDKIAGIGNRCGYQEIDREKHLYEGKDTIGDIDLILKNSQGAYLLIEAKNHALPLSVYFKDPSDTLAHLDYLKREWEKKVLRRLQHLQVNRSKYGFSENFVYIVVSRFPEVIAHFSDILTLSIDEFSWWLGSDSKPMLFHEFYSEYYTKSMTQYSKDDLNMLRENGLFMGEFVEK